MSKEHIKDGSSNSSALEGGHDATSSGVIWVLEIFLEGWKGNSRCNDTRIIAKEEPSSGEKDGREDGGSETHITSCGGVSGDFAFDRGNHRLYIPSHA
jgi:hypothetical protein